MSVFAECLVLCEEHALHCTHECAAFAGKVAVNLTLEVGFEHVARAYAYTDSHGALFGLACSVLVNSIRAVNSAAFEEERAERCARTLGSYHDNVDVSGGNDVCAFLVGYCETVREIERLAGCEVLFDFGPYLYLSRVAEEHAYDCAFFGSFFDREECLAGNPSVGNAFFIGFALTLANDYVEAVVAEVACLSGALYSVAQHGDGLVFEHFAGFV